jgi:hypothetical protein
MTIPYGELLNSPVEGRQLIHSLLKRSIYSNNDEVKVFALQKLAKLNYYLGEVDSSFYYRLQAIAVYETLGDYIGAANSYAEMGSQYKRIDLKKA